MKSKVITPILITIAILGFIVWKLVENKQTIDRNAEFSVNTVVPVKIEQPRYISIEQPIKADGQIASGNEVIINSKTTAIVLKKYKKAGDAVSKGTIIAQLQNDVIRQNLRNAEADFAKAQKDVERFQNLAAIGAVTVREAEEVQIALRSIENLIADLKDQLNNTTIVSPVSGIINKDYFEEGSLLALGGQVAEIVNNRDLKMKINMTEKEVLHLRKGEKATITTDVYPGETFTGTIDVIAPKGNEMYNYLVELVLDNVSVGANNRSPLLKPGMYATANFDTKKDDVKSIVINRKALAGGIKDPYVFIIKDNKAYKVAIQLGQINNDFIEVTQGISIDDLVVISGQINLREGYEVSIIKS